MYKMAAVAGVCGNPPDLRDLRVDLDKMSRIDLQTLAKKLHIAANLKSELIIEQIAQQRRAFMLEIANETEGLVRMHLAAMKTMTTKAEASGVALGIVNSGSNSFIKFARVALMEGYEGMLNGEAQEMEVLSQPEIPVIPQVSVPIYVGKIPKTVRNDELQEKFHTKDPVKRFGKGKFGFAKLFAGTK